MAAEPARPWSDPDSDPLGDIRRTMERIVQPCDSFIRSTQNSLGRWAFRAECSCGWESDDFSYGRIYQEQALRRHLGKRQGPEPTTQ